MPRIKFGINGAGQELDGSGFYNGELPPKGTYQFKLKRLQLGKTTGGENPGTPKLTALLEIAGPKSAKKYFGYGVFRTLVISEKTVPFVNQFLNSLTDGSEVAIKRIQNAFWGDGPYADKDGHVQKIGNIVVNSPEGERTLTAMMKHGTYEGEKRGEIARFLVPVNARETTDDEDDEADAFEDDDTDLDDTDLDDDADDDADSDEDEDDESDDDEDEDEDDEDVNDGGEVVAPPIKKSKSKAPF